MVPAAVLNEAHASDAAFSVLVFEGIMLNVTTSFIAHQAIKDCGCSIKKASNKKDVHFYESYE